MKQAVVIRHVLYEGPDTLAGLLAAHGFGLRQLDAGVDDLRTARDADLLVVMGGPIGANDERDYPFLRDELALLQERAMGDRPVLGICLGAQLLARALGARVTGGRREVGWETLQLTGAGQDSPLRHLHGVPVFHWHSDTFSLPRGADCLAATPHCENQAFRHGRMLGLQFHPEVSARNLERWYIGNTRELRSHDRPGVAELRADGLRNAGRLREAFAKLCTEWLDNIRSAE